MEAQPVKFSGGGPLDGLDAVFSSPLPSCLIAVGDDEVPGYFGPTNYVYATDAGGGMSLFGTARDGPGVLELTKAAHARAAQRRDGQP